MTPDDARLVEIRARVGAATDGPWFASDSIGRYAATFIAAARSDVPWLLDRLAAESARADKAEAAVERVRARHTNDGGIAAAVRADERAKVLAEVVGLLDAHGRERD